MPEEERVSELKQLTQDLASGKASMEELAEKLQAQ